MNFRPGAGAAAGGCEANIKKEKSMYCRVVICVLMLALTGCSQGDGSGDNVLARFQGGVLTTEDVDAHLASLKKRSEFRDKPEILTPEFAFEHALNMEMIIARGLEEKLHEDAYIRNNLHEQMSDLFMKILTDKLVSEIDPESITDEEIKQYYEANKDAYTVKARYSLSAFEVDRLLAEQALEKLKGGEISFAEAVTEYGLNEREKKSGGKTGSRTLRRFQPSWQPVVEALEVGVVSGPTEIDGKIYLLLLESKTEPYMQDFEKRKAYIRNDVLYSRYREQWQQLYDDMKKQYEVDINDSNLKNYYKKMAESKKEESTGKENS